MTTMIDTDQNAELATQWLSWISAGDVASLLSTSTPDWQMHGGPPNLPAGPAGVCVLAAHLADVRQTWTVDDVIAAGDRVVVRATNVLSSPVSSVFPAQASSRCSPPLSSSTSTLVESARSGVTPTTSDDCSSSGPRSAALLWGPDHGHRRRSFVAHDR